MQKQAAIILSSYGNYPTGGVATAGVAATATVTAAASLYTRIPTTTAGAVSILNNNQVYILTVRSDTTFTNQVMLTWVDFKFPGCVIKLK